jgi:large subunit ribosomal protein L24
MVSKSPRKQRRNLANMPIHLRKRRMSAHLSEELRKQYGVRSIILRKGDVVEVVRGAFKGHVNKVASVDRKRGLIHVEGVTIAKSDEKQVARPIHPSNVIITKLDTSDPLRKKKLDELAKKAKEASK